MTSEELLKTTEVAKLLRVHPKHVYRLIDQGLPGRRVGGEWRFLREEVLTWSSSRGQPAEGATSRAGGAPTQAPRAEVAPLLAANGDVVIELLLAQLVADDRPLVGFVQSDRRTALRHLERRSVLLAGHHAEDPPARLEADRLARIHLVHRQVGFAHPRSVRLRTPRDLARHRLALRPSSAGIRAHLDHALAAERLSLRALEVEATTYGSHREAVCAVVRGEADVALATSAWAERVGLTFSPLAEESYDLLVYADSLGDPRVVGVCEVAQSRVFRAALGKISGYRATRAGEIRYERDRK